MTKQTRREFLKTTGAAIASIAVASEAAGAAAPVRKPNVVIVFADQWRAQATGYAGDPNVKTPHLDRFARESAKCVNAVSCCPVCSPYRASLLTGQYPHTHGVFVNDVYLSDKATSIAESFKSSGYDTAYIGKWHIDGHGRSAFIPRERRQGFDHWHVLECTHDYSHSPYYGETPEKLYWKGYDARAQSDDAIGYINSRKKNDKPFLLVLSYGPPHNPYETAPEEFKALYDPAKLVLRDNVPDNEQYRKDLAGYYAHCSALDKCFGDILASIDTAGQADDTLVLFTSDHGDMLGSQDQHRKQRPWDESIMVPFLLRYPRKLGARGRTVEEIINAPDVMPTVLGLCGVSAPPTVEGDDLSDVIIGKPGATSENALIACYQPFGEWTRKQGGKEYRGLRTQRFTYVRDLKGPWLLFDNQMDPYQLKNVCGDPQFAEVQHELDEELTAKLKRLGDGFLSGDEMIKKWGYKVDANGTVPYKP